MKLRLDKLLSNSGFGSRQKIRELAKQNKIIVNGNIISDVSTKIDTSDTIICNGDVVEYSEFTYIVMNKPSGYVSACSDKLHPTVIDLLEPRLQKLRLSPVGRLDIDTEGLLFLSNDGDFIHNIISPNKNITKTYYIRSESPLSENDINTLENGVLLITENYITKPATIDKITENEYLITISEGKFHQVKRMLIAVGNKVTYLKRIKIANFKLPENLSKGEYKIVKKSEILNYFE